MGLNGLEMVAMEVAEKVEEVAAVAMEVALAAANQTIQTAFAPADTMAARAVATVQAV